MPSLFAPAIIIGGADQRFLIAEQLRAAGLEVGRIVVEPMGRNTGPRQVLVRSSSARCGAARHPDALILSAPRRPRRSWTRRAFRRTIARGVPAAEAGKVVLFGVTPTRPATGYGYIEPGAGIDHGGAAR